MGLYNGEFTDGIGYASDNDRQENDRGSTINKLGRIYDKPLRERQRASINQFASLPSSTIRLLENIPNALMGNVAVGVSALTGGETTKYAKDYVDDFGDTAFGANFGDKDETDLLRDYTFGLSTDPLFKTLDRAKGYVKDIFGSGRAASFKERSTSNMTLVDYFRK